MMMRPRRYGTLNRSIARATSHAVNQAFRSNSRKNKYNNIYNTVKMPVVRSEEYTDTMVGIGIILLVAFFVLPFVVPGLWILYFIGFVCAMLKVIFG